MKRHFSLRVRFLLILEVFGSCCSSFVGKHSNDDIYTHTDTWQRRLETLGRYDIGVSKISYTGTVIQLIFPISDQVPDNSVSATTFSDSDCSVDITGNDFLVPTIIYDENPDPDGTKNREVTIRYDIDPEGIQKSAVWVQDEQNQFFMNFCVSISLHSGDAETTSVSKTTETLVQLQVDLIGDFGTEMQVTPNDPNLESILQKYYVDGYLCDDNLQPIAYMVPVVQGVKVRVCVQPTDDALQDGVYMRSVDSFRYQRQKPEGGLLVTQVALRDGKSADPAMTEHFCERGWELCYFDTILKADFYFGPGRVIGYGEAWLQYGTGSARKLEFAIFRQYQSRDLQEVDGGFAGSAQFRLDFLVSPDAKFKYGAIAYECDSQSRKIDKTTPKRIGASIRVCITPDNESSAYEMTINRIDSWNWTRQEMASQVSVETGGQQAKNDLTILVCVPGATLCIFRTQFTEDFYKSDGTVNGLGDVVLQFSLQDNDNISVARRRTLVAIPSKKRQLQVPEIAVGLIVGTARVEVKTSVANSINDLPEHCKYDHTVAGWWEEESKKDKIRHIAMAAGILAAVACSICCCWCCPCLARRDEEDKIIEKDGAGNIKVRVDVKTGTKETFISNQSSAQGVSKKRHLSCDDTETSESSIEKHKKKRSSSKIRLDIGDGSAEGGPDVHDVCFDEKSHLGTKELIDAIRRFQTNSPNEHFGPHAYRLIKKELRDVRYFRTTLKGRYVETSKKETVTLLGDLFDQVKRGKLRISGSAKSLNDLESNMEESREVRRGSKRSVQNEKRRRRVLDEAA